MRLGYFFAVLVFVVGVASAFGGSSAAAVRWPPVNRIAQTSPAGEPLFCFVQLSRFFAQGRQLLLFTCVYSAWFSLCIIFFADIVQASGVSESSTFDMYLFVRR